METHGCHTGAVCNNTIGGHNSYIYIYILLQISTNVRREHTDVTQERCAITPSVVTTAHVMWSVVNTSLATERTVKVRGRSKMTSPGEEGGRSDKLVTNGDKRGGGYWQVVTSPSNHSDKW